KVEVLSAVYSRPAVGKVGSWLERNSEVRAGTHKEAETRSPPFRMPISGVPQARPRRRRAKANEAGYAACLSPHSRVLPWPQPATRNWPSAPAGAVPGEYRYSAPDPERRRRGTADPRAGNRGSE